MSDPDDTVWLLGTPKDGDVVIARCSRCSKRLDIEMKIHPLKKTPDPKWLKSVYHVSMVIFWGAIAGIGIIVFSRFLFGVGG